MYIKRILLAIVFIGLIGFALFANFVYKAMFKPNTKFEEKKVYITIPSNATYALVRKKLEPFIDNMDSFDALASKKEYINNIRAGRFPIENGMNNNAIINSIRSKNTPLKLTFNNQETLQDLAGRISQQIEADSISLYNVFIDSIFLKKHNLKKETALSMYIPNTYEVYWNTSAEDFQQKMLIYHQGFWNSKREKQALALGLNIENVYTLASIVQKETTKVDERPRVAGVYVNRLKAKMPLQADPTVIYAIKDKYKAFDTIIKRVLYKHLEIDSPYNTYKHTGLPPGPIAMPDISSIDAVLNYEKHSYYYFVADVKRFGYHKFAKTNAQHERNAAEYRRWVAKQGYK